MKHKSVAIVGAGGHGRVVLHALRSAGKRIDRLTDADPAQFGAELDGCRVTSDECLLQERTSAEVTLALGVGSIGPAGRNHLRRRIATRMKTAGFDFLPVVHSSAWVADSARLGFGVQIHAGAVVQPGAVLEDFAIVNTGATVDHDCHVGAFAHVAPGVTLSGDVHVGAGAHIGTGASVIQGIALGTESLIAAGAVVVANVADCACVAGVPARIMEPS